MKNLQNLTQASRHNALIKVAHLKKGKTEVESAIAKGSCVRSQSSFAVLLELMHNSNGMVESSQRTALEEFWATIELNDANFNLTVSLREWQNYYNHERPHSSLQLELSVPSTSF